MRPENGFIVLKGTTPIGEGLHRTVYLHPRDTSTVVKVGRADFVMPPAGWLRRAKRLIIPSKAGRDAFVEAGEAMRAALRAQGRGGRLPIPAFRGLANTDLGLATLHERILNADGSTASPLRSFSAPDGPIDGDALEAVAEMMRRLLALNVVVRDFHPNNVVVSRQPSGLVCALVDGYGDWATMRLRSMSPRINALKTHRQFAHFAARIHAVWDPEAHRLVPAGPP